MHSPLIAAGESRILREPECRCRQPLVAMLVLCLITHELPLSRRNMTGMFRDDVGLGSHSVGQTMVEARRMGEMTTSRLGSETHGPAAKEQNLSTRKIPPGPPLHTLHHTFTDGGNYWRDNYLLERWDRSQQPVVYLGQTYGGYELRQRLGHWCWLTKDPLSG